MRPVFLPVPEDDQLVNEVPVEFTWFAGMSIAQKQRSVRSLHLAAETLIGAGPILEISSKSEDALGRRLSAFRLETTLPDGVISTIECAFQGSKVFRDGGPYRDLYRQEPRLAKRDPRLTSSGPLQGFAFFGEWWDLEPRTAFYDWLYCSALDRSGELDAIMRFKAFTDIEFSPARSVNCQARSAARLVALERRGDREACLRSPEAFRGSYARQV